MNHMIESRDSLLVELDDRNLSRQQALANQALLRKAQGDLTGALHIYREAESICRQNNDAAVLSAALGNQGVILQTLGDVEGALRLFQEKEAVCRLHNDPSGLATSLLHQANLLALHLSRSKEGLALAEEAYQLATGHQLHTLARQIEPTVKKIRDLLT